MARNHEKATRRQLRKLKATAHERELAAALGKLHEQFAEWRSGRLNLFDLSDLIHQFHQETARDIWRIYSGPAHEALPVARAWRLGLLSDEEIGPDLAEQLTPLRDFWMDDGADEE